MRERSIPIAEARAAAAGDASPPLSLVQRRTLRAAAALVVPASGEFDVPGADDELIAADLERTLGRDRADVLLALAKLDAAAGGALADQPAARREAAGRWLRENEPALAATFAGLVLLCYYRDDRVMLSLGLEARAPYPEGFEVEQGDWSLLEPVRSRPPSWRQLP